MLISINWIEKSSIVKSLCLSPRTAKLPNASKKLVRIFKLITLISVKVLNFLHKMKKKIRYICSREFATIDFKLNL